MLLSVQTYACSCATMRLVEYYQTSDFIAKAEILTVVEDKLNDNYHDITLGSIDVYKGAKVSKLKVTSSLRTSCGFLPAENTTWLIFASKDRNGFLTFGFCSGSKQIDRQFDLVEYPDLDKKYKKEIDRKLEVLAFLRKHKITDPNKFDLRIDSPLGHFDELKGFSERKTFAVYELSVNRDLSIENVRPLREFSNKELSGKLLQFTKNDLRFNKKQVKSLLEKSKVIVVFFSYPAEGTDQSFISTFDL